MSTLTEAALLREVARVQHTKTLQSVRDVMDTIPVKKPSSSRSWDTEPRSAEAFRDDLTRALQKMREDES